MKNKKAMFENVFSWIPKLILLAAIILAVMFFIRMYVVTRIDTKETESVVLINRMLYSPHGIVYFDENLNRAYPGIIDLSRFNDSVLNKSMYLPHNRMISAKLTLYNLDKEEIDKAYFNKKWYENWVPRTRLSGPGGTTKIIKEVYVLLKSEECLDITKITNGKVKGCNKINKVEGDGLDLKQEAENRGDYIDWALLKEAIENREILFALTSDLDVYVLNLGESGIDLQIPCCQRFKDPENKAPTISTFDSAHYYIPKCSYIVTELKSVLEPTEKPDACYIPDQLEPKFKSAILKLEVIIPNT